MPVSPLVAAVAAYSARVLPDLLDLGPATSALAPWMLAALVAPGASGHAAIALERELGLPAGPAAAELRRLLSAGPTALRCALAAWRSVDLAGDGAFAAWEQTVPSVAATGPVPSQADADAWTLRQTLGLIERFPLAVTPDTVALLAAAIASRIRWDEPLGTGTAPANDWGLARMLYADPRGVHATDAGHVAVATSRSRADQLEVHSFIAAPGTDRAGLVRAALRLVAAWHADGAMDPAAWPVDPDTLPETGHAWTSETGYGDGSAMVPAFAERASAVDIAGLPGIREAGRVMATLVDEALPPSRRPAVVDARLSAVARYDRLGFEAAAVAGMGVMAGAMPGERRVLHLAFTRPHLVLAVATDEVCAGLPLFAAWVDSGVMEPDDPAA